jgi:hypothetical protein
MAEPKELHWEETNNILRYLCGTISYGLVYKATNYFRMIDYKDSNLAGCIDEEKSS